MPSRPGVSLLCLLLAAAPAAPARAVDAQRFEIDGGSYVARLPGGWDGIGRLPLLVFFHGYRQQGATVMSVGELTAAADRHRVLLVAPDGLEGSWAHQGSPSSARDESFFLDTLLADVEQRWPIDRARVWAGGFSQGGSMAWHAACHNGKSFTAFMPVAGGFWRPHPKACPAGPVSMLHTHGTADAVVPMTGRTVRGTFRQGDVREGLAFWRSEAGCEAQPARHATLGDLDCEVWSRCRRGHELRLCLHGGGHLIPKGWAEAAFRWAEALVGRTAP